MSANPERVLVTGALGLFGGNLVPRLLEERYGVVAFGHTPTDLARIGLLRWFERQSCFTFEAGDITDPNRVKDVLMRHKPGTVVHLAAMIRGSEEKLRQVNVGGTNNVVTAVRETGEDTHIINVSTTRVFDGACGLANEHTPVDIGTLTDPYARTKFEAEDVVQAWVGTGGSATTIRPTHTYGPGQKPAQGLVANHIAATMRGERPKVFRYVPGLDLLHASDAACGIVTVLKSGERQGTVYVLASGKVTPLEEIARQIQHAFGNDEDHIDFVDPPANTPQRACSLDPKALRGLGWVPKVSLQEGIEGMVRWSSGDRVWIVPQQLRTPAEALLIPTLPARVPASQPIQAPIYGT